MVPTEADVEVEVASVESHHAHYVRFHGRHDPGAKRIVARRPRATDRVANALKGGDQRRGLQPGRGRHEVSATSELDERDGATDQGVRCPRIVRPETSGPPPRRDRR